MITALKMEEYQKPRNEGSFSFDELNSLGDDEVVRSGRLVIKSMQQLKSAVGILKADVQSLKHGSKSVSDLCKTNKLSPETTLKSRIATQQKLSNELITKIDSSLDLMKERCSPCLFERFCQRYKIAQFKASASYKVPKKVQECRDKRDIVVLVRKNKEAANGIDPDTLKTVVGGQVSVGLSESQQKVVECKRGTSVATVVDEEVTEVPSECLKLARAPKPVTTQSTQCVGATETKPNSKSVKPVAIFDALLSLGDFVANDKAREVERLKEKILSAKERLKVDLIKEGANGRQLELVLARKDEIASHRTELVSIVVSLRSRLVQLSPGLFNQFIQYFGIVVRCNSVYLQFEQSIDAEIQREFGNKDTETLYVNSCAMTLEDNLRTAQTGHATTAKTGHAAEFQTASTATMAESNSRLTKAPNIFDEIQTNTDVTPLLITRNIEVLKKGFILAKRKLIAGGGRATIIAVEKEIATYREKIGNEVLLLSTQLSPSVMKLFVEHFGISVDGNDVVFQFEENVDCEIESELLANSTIKGCIKMKFKSDIFEVLETRGDVIAQNEIWKIVRLKKQLITAKEQLRVDLTNKESNPQLRDEIVVKTHKKEMDRYRTEIANSVGFLRSRMSPPSPKLFNRLMKPLDIILDGDYVRLIFDKNVPIKIERKFGNGSSMSAIGIKQVIKPSSVSNLEYEKATKVELKSLRREDVVDMGALTYAEDPEPPSGTAFDDLYIFKAITKLHNTPLLDVITAVEKLHQRIISLKQCQLMSLNQDLNSTPSSVGSVSGQQCSLHQFQCQLDKLSAKISEGVAVLNQKVGPDILVHLCERYNVKHPTNGNAGLSVATECENQSSLAGSGKVKGGSGHNNMGSATHFEIHLPPDLTKALRSESMTTTPHPSQSEIHDGGRQMNTAAQSGEQPRQIQIGQYDDGIRNSTKHENPVAHMHKQRSKFSETKRKTLDLNSSDDHNSCVNPPTAPESGTTRDSSNSKHSQLAKRSSIKGSSLNPQFPKRQSSDVRLVSDRPERHKRRKGDNADPDRPLWPERRADYASDPQQTGHRTGDHSTSKQYQRQENRPDNNSKPQKEVRTERNFSNQKFQERESRMDNFSDSLLFKCQPSESHRSQQQKKRADKSSDPLQFKRITGDYYSHPYRQKRPYDRSEDHLDPVRPEHRCGDYLDKIGGYIDPHRSGPRSGDQYDPYQSNRLENKNDNFPNRLRAERSTHDYPEQYWSQQRNSTARDISDSLRSRREISDYSVRYRQQRRDNASDDFSDPLRSQHRTGDPQYW